MRSPIKLDSQDPPAIPKVFSGNEQNMGSMSQQK